MDLEEQLRRAFPDHNPEEGVPGEPLPEFWVQEEPLRCKYEKRRGKAVTVIEGYNGAEADFRKLSKALKTWLGAGGSFKDGTIIIQGDFRERIMAYLTDKGFTTKRVGG